jgi:release factor glutamine methyltransferase
MASIHDHVASARHRLRDAGLSPAEADLSARLLAEHLLGWTTERFFADGVEHEPEGFAAEYEAAVARRAAREPLPYITGEREFWGLSFEVTPDVLIPRPETEIIVEAVLELYPDQRSAFDVVDVCTGSGCVAVAIAVERPRATVLAADISAAAIVVARRNAARHRVSERVRFLRTDLLEAVSGEVDLILANPPYVRSGDRGGLQPEVREEPEVALYAGPEGLDAIARLVRDAPARLRPDGHLIFEFGLGQELAVERLIHEVDELALVELRRDLQGIARTAVARRSRRGT